MSENVEEVINAAARSGTVTGSEYAKEGLAAASEGYVNAAARSGTVTGSGYATEGLAAASEGAGPTRLTDAEVEDL